MAVIVKEPQSGKNMARPQSRQALDMQTCARLFEFLALRSRVTPRRLLSESKKRCFPAFRNTAVAAVGPGGWRWAIELLGHGPRGGWVYQ